MGRKPGAKSRPSVCAYFLADPDDYATHRAAESHGFELSDVRVTFAIRLDGGRAAATTPACVPAGSTTFLVCGTIAAGSYRHITIYVDRRFPRERCDRPVVPRDRRQRPPLLRSGPGGR